MDSFYRFLLQVISEFSPNGVTKILNINFNRLFSALSWACVLYVNLNNYCVNSLSLSVTGISANTEWLQASGKHNMVQRGR